MFAQLGEKGKKRLSGSIFPTFATFWTQFVTERVGINYIQIWNNVTQL